MKINELVVKVFILLALTTTIALAKKKRKRKGDDEEDPYTSMDPKKREPSPCEVCKYFATELQKRLNDSGKYKQYIETGHGIMDKDRKRTDYSRSELRLTEALHEPHICEKILEYNVHAERKGSLRYAKGQSETMSTLHGLVNKGVKVDLGIPHDLWDKPSAEVSKMQRKCFHLAGEHEDDIEEWYYNHMNDIDIVTYLCADRYLKGKDQKCLEEAFVPKGDDEEEEPPQDEEDPEADENEEEEEEEEPPKKPLKKKKKNRKGDNGPKKDEL